MDYNYGSNAPMTNNEMPSFTVINGGNQTTENYERPNLQVINNTQNDAEVVTILVADDALVIRSIMKNTLQGKNVIEATNGEEALQKLKELNYKNVVLFLDLVMPGSDGYTVLKTLKANNIRIPITVISGDDSVQTIQTVCNEYGVDYINKPLSKPQILAACEKMLGQNAYTSNNYQEEQSYQRVA